MSKELIKIQQFVNDPRTDKQEIVGYFLDLLTMVKNDSTIVTDLYQSIYDCPVEEIKKL